MGSEQFYANLPVLEDFSEVSRRENFTDLPLDWHVVVTDVEGTTAAVKAGRYKDVNLLGASSIIAILNVAKPLLIPYVFGGDGASLCIPEYLLEQTREALVATRRMARNEFHLKLRVGIVPVRHIVQSGMAIRVARCRASDQYIQAAFSGGGLQFAERCVKDAERSREFCLNETAAAEETARGDFSGLECRWDNVPSAHGEIVTLLVQASVEPEDAIEQVYRDVLTEIARVYGAADACRSVSQEQMRLTLDDRKLEGEARIRAGGRGNLFRAMYRWLVKCQLLIGRMLMAMDMRFAGIDWGRYKRDIIANTDYRKFDDVLRHVLSGNARQREELTAFLEYRYKRGELIYGLHSAPTALMTCLIFQRDGNHVHFVDGADGGYTMAAAELKQRAAALLKSR